MAMPKGPGDVFCSACGGRTLARVGPVTYQRELAGHAWYLRSASLPSVRCPDCGTMQSATTGRAYPDPSGPHVPPPSRPIPWHTESE
jgi:hypothetical protein